MIQRLAAVALMAGAVWCVGCSTPLAPEGSFTVMRQQNATKAAAFDAAERALQERFRIETRNELAGVLKTEPQFETSVQHTGRLGDRLGASRRVRKSVEVRIRPEGEDIVVACKARIEENQAEAHRAFATEHRISDVPSDTPADREAAATSEQEAVWRTTGRDKALEREICDTIDELLSRPPPGAG